MIEGFSCSPSKLVLCYKTWQSRGFDVVPFNAQLTAHLNGCIRIIRTLWRGRKQLDPIAGHTQECHLLGKTITHSANRGVNRAHKMGIDQYGIACTLEKVLSKSIGYPKFNLPHYYVPPVRLKTAGRNDRVRDNVAIAEISSQVCYQP